MGKSEYKPIKNLSVHVGVGWVRIGTIMSNGVKQFAAIDSVMLSPSLLMQIPRNSRNVAVGIFDCGPYEPKQQAPATEDAPTGPTFDDGEYDDIPF